MTLKIYAHPELKQDFEAREIFLREFDSHLLSLLIDSTNLKNDLQNKDVITLCTEAKDLKFRSLCIPPCYIQFASQCFDEKKTNICTVIGFPLGYHTTETKCFEINQAIEKGADELDFVQNVCWVKNKQYVELKDEFLKIKAVSQNKLLKVILETSLLTEDEIYKCTLLAAECGIHIIKTSSGFGERGATLKDIEIIKEALDLHFDKTKILHGIKASGGIRTIEDAIIMVRAGATRIGTSNGKKIILKGT